MSEIKDFLFEICNTPSPHGKEYMCREVLDKYFKKYCNDVETTGNDSVIYKTAGKVGSMKIMLDAHMDELALMISDITDEGFLKFLRIGAIDPSCLVYKNVKIYGKNEIDGVIGIAPNFAVDKPFEKITFDDLFIDTGINVEELKRIVKIGDYAILDKKPDMILNNFVTARALDNRAGVAVLLETAKQLNNIEHKANVFYSCSSREENSGAGAASSSYQVNPDIAIVVDVSTGSMPGLNMDTVINVGEGPELPYGSRADISLFKRCKELSEKNNIPVQLISMPSSSGNDAEIIQVIREGIPCLLLSIPLRYMHTPAEIISLTDVENCGKLIAQFIKSLDDISLEELLCF